MDMSQDFFLTLSLSDISFRSRLSIRMEEYRQRHATAAIASRYSSVSHTLLELPPCYV